MVVFFLWRCEVVSARARTHAHVQCARSCVWLWTTRRGSRRNGPFYLFAQLSGGDFAMSSAFPLVLKFARSHVSFPQHLVLHLVCRGSVGPSGPPSRTWLPFGVKARGMNSLPILTLYPGCARGSCPIDVRCQVWNSFCPQDEDG